MNTEYDFSAAAETARDKVQETLATVRDQAGDAYGRSVRVVQERPGASVAGAFVLGLAVGALVAVALRPTPKKPTFGDALLGSRDRLADMFSSVAEQLRDPLQRTYSSVSESASDFADNLVQAAADRLPGKGRWW